jgi:uncharacterized membrane protein YccC
MNRDRIIALGLLTFILMGMVRGDSMEAFGLGGFVGFVLGAVLGVAFVWGEWERGRPREDQR